jgi:hypothetical protein
VNIRRRIRKLLLRIEAALRPAPVAPDLTGVVREFGTQLVEQMQRADFQRRDQVERLHELAEARQMQGTGPWQEAAGGISSAQLAQGFAQDAAPLRESGLSATGAMGQLELDLQNIEWRREINNSWLEFSRNGIQQIILLCRLYFLKNPIARRLINIVAYYVMGRGIEVSSDDGPTNDAIKEFLEANKAVIGQTALADLVRKSIYDGNLFFVFFPDTQSTGAVQVRTIDAIEIQDIVTNPDDTTEKWYFRRTFTTRTFDTATGAISSTPGEAWYPSIGYDPAEKPQTINNVPVMWASPVYHRAYGTVGKWLFGCPPIYPALDWIKASRRYLEACATLAAALAQFAVTITTKGGSQALAGIKQQLETTVGPNTNLYDQNPPPVNASTFASGPGTKMEAFHSRGQGLDPSEWKPFGAMACICLDVPPTWIGDLETANLATAQTLDRPTELAMMERQEVLREVVVTIVTYALNVQLRAPGGKLRERLSKIHDVSNLRVVEAPRKQTIELGRTRFTYLNEAGREKTGQIQKDTDLEIKVTFPSIREGDIPALIGAVVESMTLANKGGQIVGIDEKEGVRKLFELNGFENADEMVEEMYPSDGDNAYDPNRTIEDAADIQAAIPKAAPAPTGPQVPGGKQRAMVDKTPGQEALTRLGWSVERVRKLLERKAA